ncbi:antichymotrypsin-2 [Amyelois transitella]|uniref:antichymotrypsin-2 n=1 Tax=Amyelois transitella TaxID=680683 RepID=UPI00298FAB19|nr:antichymotrypsin-2 [Amyelois transitella]
MALTDTRRSAICSPISALLPLGKLAMGSSSRQFTELKNAIGHGRYSVTSKFKSLMSRLQSISGKVQLIVASRLFVPKSGQLRSEFHNRVMSVFKSSCERVDFGEPQRTAASINNWGRWKHRFTSVKYDTFYGATSMQSIQMMTIERGYQYARSSRLRAEIVQIPYAGNEVSFIAVLPYEKDGLGHLMRQLLQSPKELNNALAKLSLAYMRLSLPKFKIQSNLDLGAIYFKVGLKEIFKNNNKILTKILKGRNVFVSKSVQAAVIELSEYGTEAAGATFVEIQKISAPQFIDVNFNRPFLFYILAGSDPLFGGIFTNS